MTRRPLPPCSGPDENRLGSRERRLPSAARWTLAAALALAPALAPAQPADTPGAEPGGELAEVYLSENAMQVLYGRETDVGELGVNELRAGFFLNEARDLIGLADMLVDVGEPQRRPYWSLQVGPRAYGALLSMENQDVFSLGFGGRLSYFLGPQRRSSISVTAFYAPDIVTFGNADNIKDVSVRAETPLTDATDLFIGYRVFEFDLAVDREVDDNMHLGIRHRF